MIKKEKRENVNCPCFKLLELFLSRTKIKEIRKKLIISELFAKFLISC